MQVYNKGVFSIVILSFILCSGIHAQDIERDHTKAGELRLSVTNVGTLGYPNVLNEPDEVSMRYPASTGTEHLFEAGIWLGAMVNDELRVSTSAVTSSLGYNKGAQGYEFTPYTGFQVLNTLDGAISDFDVVTSFTDKNTFILGTAIQGHERPMHADVRMRVMSWGEENHDNLSIIKYTIVNNGEEDWEDFYFGFKANLTVRNVYTSQEVGAAFFNKGGHGYLDSLYTIYSFDAGSSDFSSQNTYGAFTILGSRYQDNFVHPRNAAYLNEQGLKVPNIRPSFWRFGSGAGVLQAPANDAERYNRMSSPFPLDQGALREDLRTDGQDAAGNYISLLSIGPYATIAAGDSLVLYVGASAALKPEEFQGTVGKPIDNEDSRINLVKTIHKQYKLVEGENLNDWSDNFVISGYTGADIYFENAVPQITYGSASFRFNITGPDAASITSIKVALNDSLQQYDVEFSSAYNFRIYNGITSSGDVKAFIETDTKVIELEEKLIEGRNTIFISAYNAEEELMDYLKTIWRVESRNHELLVINDVENYPSDNPNLQLFNSLDYDSLDFRSGGFLSSGIGELEVSESVIETLANWKGIIWIGNASGNISKAPEALSKLLLRGGKVFVYSPKLNQSLPEELKNLLGIKSEIPLSGIETTFNLAAGTLEPFTTSDTFSFDTLRLAQPSRDFKLLYRPNDNVDSLYGGDFSAQTIIGGQVDKGRIPVAWYYKEQNSAFVYFDITEVEDSEYSEVVVTTIVNDILDVEDTILNNVERGMDAEFPRKISLEQNYPNPFNPTTNILFQLDRSEDIRLKVYDMLGREVATLIDEQLSQGSHQVKFDASHLASGVYIYRLKASNTFLTKKMILIK